MERIANTQESSLYVLSPLDKVQRYLFTSPETRAITNDPAIYGVRYTATLEKSMGTLLRFFKNTDHIIGEEKETLVIHILRGGLNFGLREALNDAYGWNEHRCAFISSQRVFDEKDGWHITENRYQKVPIMPVMDLIFADVVATGVSLEHAILKFINLAKDSHAIIRRITFVTLGGDRTDDIMTKVSTLCESLFPEYIGTQVVYIEGVFGVASKNSSLSIALPGTDLLRSPALLTPEFISSQNEHLSYPIERCTIYDAGSRAFDTVEYKHDVIEYWSKVKTLSESGMTYVMYLRERYPEHPLLKDPNFVTKHDTTATLARVAEEQIEILNN